MKTFRSLATVLFVFALAHVCAAQESSEITSLRTKAEKGNGIAQYNLGLAYAEGKGVARDPIEAFVWLSLARENGARGRALDNVASALDKTSLELARQRITERKAALGKSPAAPTTAKSAPPAAADSKPAAPATAGPAGPDGAEDPAVARLRRERDAYSAKVGEIAADLFTVRTDRDRLAEQAAEYQKNAQTVSTGLQEQLRAATARTAELERNGAVLKAELDRTKQELAALAAAPKPAPDNAALEAKSRELQAALAELEASRQFGRKVEDTLNKVNDEKARVAAAAAAELEAARQFGAQVEATLNKVNDQKAALEQQLVAATQAVAAKPPAPAYPDLSGRVSELEAALAAANKTAPAYPDLRSRVADLETQFASSQATAKARAEELARANTKLAGDETAFAAVNRELAEAKNALARAKETQPSAAPAYPDLSGRVAELEGQARTLNAAVTSSTQELAAVRAQLTGATQKLEAGAAEHATLQAQLSQLRTQAAAPKSPDLTGRVAELEKQLAAKPGAPAYPDLSGRVAELEAAAATALQKFGAAEQARTELARQFDDYKSATVAAQRERTTLLANLKMLESDKVSLRRQVEAATTESNQLRTQVAALKTQAAAPKTSAPSYPDLSGKVAELTASLAALSSEAARSKQEVVALTKAKEEKPAAPGYPDLTNRVGELENQLTRANSELSAVASAKADLSGRVAELESAVTAARNAAPAYPNLSGRVAELEAALAAKPTAPVYPDLSGRVSELEAALTAARNATPAYPNLAAKVSDLETKLATSEKNAADMSAEVTSAKQQVALLAKAKDEKPTAPAYPDLSGRVNELTSEVTQLRADRERMQKLLADSGRQLAEATAANRSRPVAPPGYLDRVRELEAALAQAKAATSAPAYPDLSGRVSELEAKLAESARSSGDSAQLRRERDELSGKLSDLTSEVTRLRTDRERMQKMIADAGRQLRDNTADTARIKELETQLASAQSQSGGLASERDAARNTQNELRDTIARLERERAQLVGAKPVQAGAPPYPDLSGRVRELEAQLAAAPRGQPAPSYPDLSGRVNELESALAATKQQLASAQTAPPAAGGDPSGLERKLADTEDRLATALRGYATLQRERDSLAENAGKSAAAVTAERDALAGQVASLTGQVEQLRANAQSSAGSTQAELARLNETVTTLQRTSTQASRDAAAARALAQQLQGANAVLAGENYQLKTMLARSAGSVAPATVPVTAAVAPPTTRTHVVVAGDSLSRLSQRYYGTAGRWQEIYNANATLLGPNGVLRVGTELRIP